MQGAGGGGGRDVASAGVVRRVGGGLLARSGGVQLGLKASHHRLLFLQLALQPSHLLFASVRALLRVLQLVP